ncbi:MAG: nuclear transport factor 2 family protein [Cyanothece sp. SIO1E1]|nr:nuclear transport factor 2 family protein [Cyanothece sp. SIO1E1]
MTMQTNEIDSIHAAIDRWMTCLDSGDLENLLNCCDPEVVMANEGKPTLVGLAAMKERYAPRIEQFSMSSGFEVEHIAVYHDFAIVVGRWTVKATHKVSNQVNNASGRVLLNYRKQTDDTWKIVADIDNN